MRHVDHNPVPPPTSRRGNVNVGPDVGGRGGRHGIGKPHCTGGGKRRETELKVDADAFPDEMIRQLIDDLFVPVIVERIVTEAVGGQQEER